MLIQNNVSTKQYNSFQVDEIFPTLITIKELDDLYHLTENQFRILGGGSNILITGSSNLPVLKIDIKGIEKIEETEEYALVRFGAGENWHEVVLWALNQDFGGIENLSLIPGNCGAAPMQNIGAYGVEIKDVLHSVFAFDLASKKELIFHQSECGFGYRTSHFKTKWKDKFIITSIVLRLTKSPNHIINTSYGAIENELERNGINSPGIKDVSNAVINIRNSKLPDPKLLGNAGSFFKNPVVSQNKLIELKSKYPDIPNYPFGDQKKLAAAWLIDQCGWKGKSVGKVGNYKNQALVLVNLGGAKGDEILSHSKNVQESVQNKFGIRLEPEVNIW